MRSLRARASGRAAVVALAAALALATGTVPAGAVPAGGQGPDHATVTNAGFEQGLRGWRVTGDVAAAKVEADGRTGSRLTNWSADDYAVRSTQTVAGLRPGWWTVSAWVKSGGAFDASGLALVGCGTDARVTAPVTEQDDSWVRLAVSAYVRGGRCTVELATSGPGGAWASFDDVELSRGRVTRDIRGGELAGRTKNEDLGATYADAAGLPGDAVEILADAGMNLGRLRVWVDPADGYNDLDNVVAMGQRIKAAGSTHTRRRPRFIPASARISTASPGRPAASA